MNDNAKENNADNFRINNKKIITSKSFKYKTKIIGSTPNDNNNILDAEIVVPLKYLRNFWRSLHWLLVDSEIELHLKWTKNCVISEIYKLLKFPLIQMLIHLILLFKQQQQLE